MVAHVNNNKCTGICCDLCNMVFTDKFTYYSVKFDKVGVDIGKGQTGPVEVDKRFLDLDVCQSCYESITKTVLSKIEEREKKKGGGQWTAKT